MSTMVEKVARAIAARMEPYEPTEQWLVDTARAAIGAMAEPTEAMVIAGAAFCQNHPSAEADHIADSAYGAMLQAALASPGES